MHSKRMDNNPDIDTIVEVSNWLRNYTKAIFDKDVEFDKAKWEAEGRQMINMLAEEKRST